MAWPDPAPSVLAAMAAHRSVRSFRDEPVTEAQVEAAVEAARCASTSSWIHGYHLLQVTDAGERAELAALAGGQPQVASAGAFFVVLGDLRRHALIAAREGAPRTDSAETFLLATIDASLFAQNLTLAFEAMGLGVCYIGGLRNDLDAVDRVLELPEGALPLFGLCVGVPAEDPGRRPRLPARALWSTGRYPSDGEVLDHVDRFDEVAAAYYSQRGAKPGRNWSGGIWRKFRSLLRPRVRPYLESKGASFD